MNWANFTEQLHANGLIRTANIQDTAPVQESGYGRWLSIVGAWLAALFLLGFLGSITALLLQNALFCGVVGAALVGTGVLLGRTGRSKSSIMLGQFALIACVLGGVLLSKAILQTNPQTRALFILAALSVPCILLAKEQNQRQFFSVAGIGFVCAAFVKYNLTFYVWLVFIVAAVLLSKQQARWVVSKRGELFNALLIALSLWVLIAPFLLSKSGRWAGLIDTVADSATMRLFSGSDLSWASLGALSAVVVAAMGYFTGLKVLRNYALSAVLAYGYMFYFSIGTTLIHKAYALLASGAVLLLLRYFTASKSKGASA